MMSMNKQRGIYAGLLTLVLAVTMGISVYTASSEKEDPGYTAELPEESVAEIQEVPDRQEVQKDILERNEKIETVEVPEEAAVDKSGSDEEIEAEASEEEALTAEAQVPEEALTAEAELEANGIFFDPETDRLAWPVSGTVVMEYSQDQLIYDATLDQFRVNDSISISAEKAENVCAAASGIVSEIGYTEELGNYVVLEHGNGFRTTYGQLEDSISLTVAERVEEGDVIGQLAAPLDHSVALGDHLNFKVTLNGEAVDPMEYLEYEME